MPLFNEFSISLASELFRTTNHSVLKKWKGVTKDKMTQQTQVKDTCNKDTLQKVKEVLNK